MKMYGPTASLLVVFATTSFVQILSKSPDVVDKSNATAIQVYPTLRDWSNSVSLVTVDTSDCTFGTFSCPDGSVVCLDFFNFVGCVFDMVSPINLDEIFPVLGKAMDEFTKDPVGVFVEFVDDEVNAAINDAKTCAKGLSGQATQCSQLDVFASCLSTAALVMGGLSSKVVGAEAARLSKGIKYLDKAVDLVHDECAQGCEGGDCAAESLTFDAPAGCQCKAMLLSTGSSMQATPDSCARNTAMFLRLSSSSPYALSEKVAFSYMGCYVGTYLDKDEWASSCPQAYASSVFDGAWFVRCIDQNGRTLLLDDTDTTSSNSGNLRGPTPSWAVSAARYSLGALATSLLASLALMVVA